MLMALTRLSLGIKPQAIRGSHHLSVMGHEESQARLPVWHAPRVVKAPRVAAVLAAV